MFKAVSMRNANIIIHVRRQAEGCRGSKGLQLEISGNGRAAILFLG